MIHDEIIVEVPEANADEAATVLQYTMEAAGNRGLENRARRGRSPNRGQLGSKVTTTCA